MICTKCGEDNSDNFRFCGMCGAPLEARRPAGAPRVASTPETARTAQNETAQPRIPVAAKATMGANRTVAPAAGPSFLGLDQPFRDKPDGNGPTADPSYDQSFSQRDSFFEPDELNIGARRIVLLLVLLAALGAAGWWAFSNYNKTDATAGGNSQAAATKLGPPEAVSDKPVPEPKASPDTPSSPDAGSSQPTAQAAAPPAKPKSLSPEPLVEEKAEQKAGGKASQTASDAARLAEKKHPVHEQRIARADTSAAQRPTSATPASDDKGDAAFRKGEAYLYGRGTRQNCAEAVRNLKAASAKQNAKARSTFGTMYATGHCVPRDLPTSYSWFALALHIDPNNQILEQDLTAVWNQMTPPERQIATRMKP